MTQERFNEMMQICSDEHCCEILDNLDWVNKYKESFRALIAILEMSSNKEDMTNWHIYAEKYLLGMNEENKEIPKEG